MVEPGDPTDDVAPVVSVVIATRDRPELLREALAAVVAQTYAGVVETIVVFDQSEIDRSVESDDPRRPVRAIANTHTPGLPGSRNAGAAAADGELLAFCDDDDLWLPEKLAKQVERLAGEPKTDVVICGLEVEHRDGAVVDRSRPGDWLTFEELLASRVMGACFQAVLVRREAFVDPERIGPADEEIPWGYAEDYEWALRAARRGPIAVVAEPLVRIRWLGVSYFTRWNTIDDGLRYLVERYPEFADEPKGLARVQGQRAFALAAAGERSEAWQLVRLTLRNDWRQPRAYLAAAVAARLLPADRFVRELNRRGHGI